MFITFEGPEGSGKSTIASKVYEILKNEGKDIILTREPGGSYIAEQIRKILLKRNNTEMDILTEALLFAASRRQHLAEKVIPSIKNGSIVLCDRFIDSSLAYQGYARGIGIDKVMNINLFATEGMLPDLTILFDIESEIGLERIDANPNREVNRLDLERLEFHKKVRQGYLELERRFPERIKKIDASKSIDEVVSDCLKIIREYI